MASRGVNKVILIGNLGADPDVRYTQNSVPIANLSVATSETWKDKQTGEQKEMTEWHRVVCYRFLAEIAKEYLKKGSKVYIEGRLQTRKWQGQDGQDRYTTEIVANEMQMLDGRPGGGGSPDWDNQSRGQQGGGYGQQGGQQGGGQAYGGQGQSQGQGSAPAQQGSWGGSSSQNSPAQSSPQQNQQPAPAKPFPNDLDDDIPF